MTTPSGVRTIDDAHALRALAHPLRLELLEALTLHGPLTATAAADLVDESPANCSWHLRQLAKYGLIEEVPGATGRQRPWQRTSSGMAWHESSSDPAFAEAARALTAVFVDREFGLVKDAMSRPQPEGWGDSVIATQSMGWMTAEEMAAFDEQVFALLCEYRERVADPDLRPPGSRPVRMLALAVADDHMQTTPDPVAPERDGHTDSDDHAEGDDHA